MAVGDSYLAGYLSARFFEEDSPIGLTGENDREGFFIVGKESTTVMSGLSGASFFRVMEEEHGAKMIAFFLPTQAVAYAGCER